MAAPITIVKDSNNQLHYDSDVIQFTSPLSVSIEDGTVKVYQQLSNDWEELKSNTSDSGYVTVFPQVLRDGKIGHQICYVHRLIATLFCDNPDGKKYVDHIDGDRSNNAPSNLRWVTARENQLYRRISELKKLKSHNRGFIGDSVKQGRWVKITRSDYAEPLYFKTISDAARAIGCTSQNISMCIRRGYRPVGWNVEFVNI